MLVQRLQTAGPGQLNINQTKIKELGNYQSVGVTRDTPDLTFTMESFDVTTAPEQLFTKTSSGPYHMASPLPIDVASQWKGGQDTGTPFDVVESVAMPGLVLESASYRFGTRDNATQTFTLRGDTIFYNPGATVTERFVGTGTAGQTLALGHPAGVYNGDAVTGPRRALGVTVNGKRLLYGADYTEAATGSGNFRTVTVTLIKAVGSGVPIQVMYFTSDVVSYPQSVHSAASVKPAAVRGRDITVLLGGVALTNRVTGVQSVNVDERFTIDRDEELGNQYATSIDYSDVPNVTGSLVVRFRDPADFHSRLVAAMGVASQTEAVGPLRGVPQRLDIVIHHPDTGAVIKTLEVPDAVVTAPGYSGRVATKLDMTLSFDSETGVLDVLDGAPA